MRAGRRTRARGRRTTAVDAPAAGVRGQRASSQASRAKSAPCRWRSPAAMAQRLSMRPPSTTISAPRFQRDSSEARYNHGLTCRAISLLVAAPPHPITWESGWRSMMCRSPTRRSCARASASVTRRPPFSPAQKAPQAPASHHRVVSAGAASSRRAWPGRQDR